jgi:hypothetical protein
VGHGETAGATEKAIARHLTISITARARAKDGLRRSGDANALEMKEVIPPARCYDEPARLLRMCNALRLILSNLA